MSVGELSQDSVLQLIALWQAQPLSGATSDAVYEVLTEAIISSVLPPGQRLREEQLANLFTVSRTPVREALLRLEAEHFAKRIPRRGLIVSRITPQDIVEVYIVREAIDGLAAMLAAEHATPADISNLRWINEQFIAAAEVNDLTALAELNLKFHEALAHASYNSLLVNFMGQIHHRVRRFRSTTFSHPGRAKEAIEEHRQIIGAIVDRDGQRARQFAESHMATARLVRIAMLDDEDRADSGIAEPAPSISR